MNILEQMKKMAEFFYRPDVGLLVVRVALGAIFFHHGWLKIGDMAKTEAFMKSIGLAPSMAYAIVIVELLGGAMIILGVLTRVAAVATGIAMIVAIFTAVYPNRGIAGGEFEILLAVVSFALAFIGAGRYRLMNTFEQKEEPEEKEAEKEAAEGAAAQIQGTDSQIKL